MKKVFVFLILAHLFTACDSPYNQQNDSITQQLEVTQVQGKWKISCTNKSDGNYYSSLIDFNQDGKQYVTQMTYLTPECTGVAAITENLILPYKVITDANNRLVVEVRHYVSSSNPSSQTLFMTREELYMDKEVLRNKIISAVDILPNGTYESYTPTEVSALPIATWIKI